ncbi:MAG: cytochrome c peroxidase [Cytophagales bacterium]
MRLLFSLILMTFLVSFDLNDSAKQYKFPDLLHFPEMPVNENNIPTYAGVELGRYLFYDPILSQNRKVSCASCHKQKHAFSDAPNQFSLGINENRSKRNTLPLFNLAWYERLFWDGRAVSLEEQVFEPVRNHLEMNLDWSQAEKRINQSSFYRKMFRKAFGNNLIDSILISKAIAQFERTLISNNSRYDKALRGEIYLTEDEFAGFTLANDQSRASCIQCHTTDSDALGTIGSFSNNGLDSFNTYTKYKDKGLGGLSKISEQIGLFKIPSLRNVSVTGPYMHDGRFETLEEVIDFYSDGLHLSPNVDSKLIHARKGGAKLNSQEKRQLLAFLNSLTDSVFITNKAYSNPFSKN